MHERVACPSKRTVHAPHWPSPHPYLLPVSLRSLRSTLSRLVAESTSMVSFFPLTLRVVTLPIRTSGVFDFPLTVIDCKSKYNSGFAGLGKTEKYERLIGLAVRAADD